jgi:capsular exopolysaccharide synthesis family protein
MLEGTCVVKDTLNSSVEDAYRVLRTNIQFCGVEEQIKTLAITSTNPGEGKTTTSINLAVSLAKSGVRVLLIDADMRKPMILKTFGASNRIGLSTYISGKADVEDTIIGTTVNNLFVIGCGPIPPNPTELIGTKRFSELMKIAKTKFDMVIIDTPPLGSVIDCAIIAAQIDATLIVIQAKGVEFRNAQRVKEQLEKANARVLGVVLNKVVKSDYRYYNSYYNYKKPIEKSWLNRVKVLIKNKKDGIYD